MCIVNVKYFYNDYCDYINIFIILSVFRFYVYRVIVMLKERSWYFVYCRGKYFECGLKIILLMCIIDFRLYIMYEKYF